MKPIGAWLDERGEARFRVWAPEHERLEVVRFDRGGGEGHAHPLSKEEDGFFTLHLPEWGAGTLYKFRVDGQGPFPDPWSKSQPLGVHGPSELVDPRFAWTDHGWRGLPMDALVIYELHVGTATPEGTFDALIGRLKPLKDLGVSAVELMPLSSFPGSRNWGYDGVTLNAPQVSYGGPEGLRRFIDAAHREGLAVLIDVVYNHFGPDGNYLRAYSGHYFTGRHQTPWGEAVNYDGPEARTVRELVLRNAEMWIRDYHADGLRLDAVHAIVDDSQVPLIQEIAERAHAAGGGRTVVVTAEDERNDPRVVTPVSQGGWGLDGVWADDFHHQMRRAFAGDQDGYYADYTGSAEDLAATLNKGWFFEGQVSKVRKAPRGGPAGSLDPWRLVHCIQNHDQIGNRALGDRLGEAVAPSAYRAMSTLLLLSPYTPLLFMGQEWNAASRFQFFTDHDEALGKLVTEGRRKEFEHFEGFSAADVPDPQASTTFHRSKVEWAEQETAPHAGVLALYRELLRLRGAHPALRERGRGSFEARALGPNGIVLERRGGGETLQVVVNLRDRLELPLPPGAKVLLWSEHPRFGGAGPDMPGATDGTLGVKGPCALVLTLPR